MRVLTQFFRGGRGEGAGMVRSSGKVLAAILAAAALVVPGVSAAELPPPSWMPNFPLLAGPQVIMMWLPVPGAAKYKVYLDGKVVADGLTSFQATIPAPTAGGDHLAEIVAVDDKGVEGKKSPPGKISILVLEPPKELSALGQEKAISVRWAPTKGAVIYDLFRKEEGAREFTLVTSTQDTRYTDSSVTKAKKYTYAVKSKDVSGKSSAFSQEAVASTQEAVASAAVKQFKLTGVPSRKVDFNWLEYYNPQDVAVAADGRVLVGADALILFPKGVSEFADKEELLAGKRGFIGVAFGNKGEILAAHNSGEVLVISPDGKNVMKTLRIPRPGKGELVYGRADRPNDPFQRTEEPKATDIAQDPQGNYYVVDNPNYRVVKFSPEGAFLGTVAYEKGKEDWLVFNPVFIAVDQRGNKFVNQSFGLQVFDKDDRRAGFVGQMGQGYGAFTAATGIAVDPKGRIVISDIRSGSVQGFAFDEKDKGWDPVFALSDEANQSAVNVTTPVGIAVSADGKKVFISEGMPRRVSVFQMGELKESK